VDRAETGGSGTWLLGIDLGIGNLGCEIALNCDLVSHMAHAIENSGIWLSGGETLRQVPYLSKYLVGAIFWPMLGKCCSCAHFHRVRGVYAVKAPLNKGIFLGLWVRQEAKRPRIVVARQSGASLCRHHQHP
jgi:hypothetical protein